MRPRPRPSTPSTSPRRLGASLLVVSVIDPGSLLLPGGRFRARVDQVRERRERDAQALVERGRELGVEVSFLVWTGDPGDQIVSAAEAERVDMVLVGATGGVPSGGCSWAASRSRRAQRAVPGARGALGRPSSRRPDREARRDPPAVDAMDPCPDRPVGRGADGSHADRRSPRSRGTLHPVRRHSPAARCDGGPRARAGTSSARCRSRRRGTRTGRSSATAGSAPSARPTCAETTFSPEVIVHACGRGSRPPPAPPGCAAGRGPCRRPWASPRAAPVIDSRNSAEGPRQDQEPDRDRRHDVGAGPPRDRDHEGGGDDRERAREVAQHLAAYAPRRLRLSRCPWRSSSSETPLAASPTAATTSIRPERHDVRLGQPLRPPRTARTRRSP